MEKTEVALEKSFPIILVFKFEFTLTKSSLNLVSVFSATLSYETLFPSPLPLNIYLLMTWFYKVKLNYTVLHLFSVLFKLVNTISHIVL